MVMGRNRSVGCVGLRGKWLPSATRLTRSRQAQAFLGEEPSRHAPAPAGYGLNDYMSHLSLTTVYKAAAGNWISSRSPCRRVVTGTSIGWPIARNVSQATQGNNRARIPAYTVKGPGAMGPYEGPMGQGPWPHGPGAWASPFSRETLRKNGTRKKRPSGPQEKKKKTFYKLGPATISRWAQTIPGPKQAWGQNGLWALTGPMRPWPKQTLGRMGPGPKWPGPNGPGRGRFA